MGVLVQAYDGFYWCRRVMGVLVQACYRCVVASV